MKIVALFLSAYLFVGSLLPRTDFSQLVRLGSVKDHYEQHRQAGDNLTFWTFLWIHFITPDGHHHDADDLVHHQLPFHSVSNPLILACADYSLPFLDDMPKCPRSSVFHVEGYNLRDHATSVFRPPLTT